jgi:putative addiction module component (TIGR02574 family)
MSPKAEQLLQEALQLPPEERTSIAESLFESLDEVDDALGTEIRKRLDEVDSGEVQPIPWEEARRLLNWDA